jgi:adenylate cyclase
MTTAHPSPSPPDPFAEDPAAGGVQISKSRSRLIVEEFLANSAHYPAANIFLELLLEGPRAYLFGVDFYAILLAACVQAIVIGTGTYLGRNWQFLGNLVGPALYTAIEFSFEGMGFFNGPHHIAYWIFALSIGSMRQIRYGNTSGPTAYLATILEGLLRASIFLVMYAIFEALNDNQTLSVTVFLSENTHTYVATVLPLLGLLLGAAAVNADIYESRLTETADRLKAISSWSWGPKLVAASIENPDILQLTRQDRTVLFMDIRGFTAWSETKDPQTVVTVLNDLFAQSERSLQDQDIVRAKHIGDELMLVLGEDVDAIDIATTVARTAAGVLVPHGLSVGIGVHRGPVIEGLMGGENVRSYDVIGDTVNTAARLCGAAGPFEILASEAIVTPDSRAPSTEVRELSLKGKSAPMTVAVIDTREPR